MRLSPFGVSVYFVSPCRQRHRRKDWPLGLASGDAAIHLAPGSSAEAETSIFNSAPGNCLSADGESASFDKAAVVNSSQGRAATALHDVAQLQERTCRWSPAQALGGGRGKLQADGQQHAPTRGRHNQFHHHHAASSRRQFVTPVSGSTR